MCVVYRGLVFYSLNNAPSYFNFQKRRKRFSLSAHRIHISKYLVDTSYSFLCKTAKMCAYFRQLNILFICDIFPKDFFPSKFFIHFPLCLCNHRVSLILLYISDFWNFQINISHENCFLSILCIRTTIYILLRICISVFTCRIKLDP